MNIQIASVAEEQTAVAKDINRKINDINSAVKQTLEGAEHPSKSSETLAALADELQSGISKYKT